jgi:hypothetical protein
VAEEGRFVHAANETFDDMAGPEIKPGDARHRLRAEETSGIAGSGGH